MTYLLYILYLYMMFSNVLERYIGIFRYADEGLCILLLFIALAKVFRTHDAILEKTDMMIVVGIICLFLIGIISTVQANVIETYTVIVKDIVLTFKFFIAFISIKILLEDFRSKQLSKMLTTTSKIILVLHFLFSIATQFVNTGMSDEMRHGIKCYQFFYSHYTFLVFYVVVLLCTINCGEKKSLKYDVLGTCVLIFTARTKAIMFIVIYFIIKYFIIKVKKNGNFIINFKKRYIILAGIGALMVGYSKIQDYIGWGYSFNLRNALYVRGLQIAGRFFPLGSGFGSFATNISFEYKSKLYEEYNMYVIQGFVDGSPVVSDVFWPSIYSQFGIIGFCIYVGMLICIFKSIIGTKKICIEVKISVFMLMLYLLVASIAEATFTNDIGVFAIVFSYIFLTKRNEMIQEDVE